jgi:hypothetical protein
VSDDQQEIAPKGKGDKKDDTPTNGKKPFNPSNTDDKHGDYVSGIFE